MPYNDNERSRSWDLLKQHASRAGDNWARRAYLKDCPYDIDAIACVCQESNAKSSIDPTFDCRLQKGDVVLLISNKDVALECAIEAEVSGTANKFALLKNGKTFEFTADEVLPPGTSKFFRRSPSYYVVVFRLTGTAPDRVAIRFQIAPDSSVGTKVLQKLSRRVKPRIRSGEARAIIDLSCEIQ